MALQQGSVIQLLSLLRHILPFGLLYCDKCSTDQSADFCHIPQLTVLQNSSLGTVSVVCITAKQPSNITGACLADSILHDRASV